MDQKMILTTSQEKYVLDGLIGHGSYGTVNGGKRLRDGTTVAIKKIKLCKEDEGISVSSLREIGILKKLKHENIITLYETTMSNNAIYLIFEKMDVDLKKYIQNVLIKEMDLRKVKLIMYQVFKAVKYCHNHKIIHRDIKPHNILLNINEMKVKLADFGLSRLVTLPGRAYTHEVVTLWYRAPEILLGSDHYNTSVDIWSLGVLFTELLTGSPIFQGDAEITQLFCIFKILGTPNEEIWPKSKNLPYFIKTGPKWYSKLDKYLEKTLIMREDPEAADLIKRIFKLDPEKRINIDDALKHPYFFDMT